MRGIQSLPPDRALEESPRSWRRWIVAIFFAGLCLYGLSMRGTLSRDEEMFFLVAEAIGNRGEVAVGETVFTADSSVTGVDGREYSYFDLGQSLLALPLQQLAHRVGAAFPEGLRPFIERFATNGLGPLAGALTLVLTFLLGLRAGLSRREALVAVLLLAIATPLWFYSRTLFRAPVLAALYCLIALFGLRALERGTVRDGFFAGLALGVAILVKSPSAILGVPLGLLFLWRAPRERKGWVIAAMAAPVLCAVAGVMLYMKARFGIWFGGQPGFEGPFFATPLREGLPGVLLSPGRGLILFCPLVLGLLAIGRAFRRRVAEEWRAGRYDVPVLAITAITITILHAKWKWWTGGICWGPRFLVPILPHLAILVALVLRERPQLVLRSRVFRPIAAAVIAFSIFVQFVGVTTEGRHLTKEPAGPDYRASVEEWQWSTPLSPILWGSPFVAEFTPMPQEVSRGTIQGAGFESILNGSWAIWWVYLYRVGLSPFFLLPAIALALGFVFSLAQILRLEWRASRSSKVTSVSERGRRGSRSPA